MPDALDSFVRSRQGLVEFFQSTRAGRAPIEVVWTSRHWRKPSSGPRNRTTNKEAMFERPSRALGALRGLTVVLGLVSLAHVAASFTETIKATAPIFTVWTARVVLRQRTSGPVVASLIPVMVGLVVCAHTEVSYDAIGFWAALGQ